MLCSANIWLGLKRLDVGAHIPSGVVGGPLNSRPLPMKLLVICILSLAALIRHSMNSTVVIMQIYTASLAGTVPCWCRDSASLAQWQKGESPTCKCGDWCFLSWRLQCGSYQDLLIPTLGLRSPILILIFLSWIREQRWWWEWRWRGWQSQERTVEKWPPWAVDSQSVPWAGAHSQPSEDVSLFSFFLWQEQLKETPSGSQLYESLIVVIFVVLIPSSLISFVSHCCTCACWR